MDSAPLCQLLEWDSDFFGRRIGRVMSSSLTSATMSQALAWCKVAGIECLYFLAESGDAFSIRLAQENSFALVDVRVTLQLRLDCNHKDVPPVAAPLIRGASPDDLEPLRGLARISHRDSRFYYDSHFPGSKCDELYATWIEKSCKGMADQVFVARGQGCPVGYVTCKKVDASTGQIGLIAVAAEAQGCGLGGALISEAFRWFREQNLHRVLVVTQGRNVAAQRLYQGYGFRTSTTQLWFHRWFDGEPSTMAGSALKPGRDALR